VVPSETPPRNTCTTALGSAVPSSLTVVALVISSVLLAPVSGVMPVIVGTLTCVSMVRAVAEEACPTLPAASVAAAVTLYVPSPRALLVIVQAPVAPAVVVPSRAAPA
jgi:hypothetical protein